MMFPYTREKVRSVMRAAAAKYPASLEDAATSAPPTSMLVYEDPLTRHWALEIRTRMAKSHEEARSHDMCWPIWQLVYPGLLEAAVDDAVRANVLVISIHAHKRLPPDLYTWTDIWLPRRPRRFGALVALLGVSEDAFFRPRYTAACYEYFRAVARKAELGLHIEEKAYGPDTESPEDETESLGTSPSLPLLSSESLRQPLCPRREYGINE